MRQRRSATFNDHRNAPQCSHTFRIRFPTLSPPESPPDLSNPQRSQKCSTMLSNPQHPQNCPILLSRFKNLLPDAPFRTTARFSTILSAFRTAFRCSAILSTLRTTPYCSASFRTASCFLSNPQHPQNCPILLSYFQNLLPDAAFRTASCSGKRYDFPLASYCHLGYNGSVHLWGKFISNSQ